MIMTTFWIAAYIETALSIDCIFAIYHQGEPLSPTIFNVVVVTVVRHWVSLVAEVAEGTGGWGMEVCLTAFFYKVRVMI